MGPLADFYHHIWSSIVNNNSTEQCMATLCGYLLHFSVCDTAEGLIKGFGEGWEGRILLQAQ